MALAISTACDLGTEGFFIEVGVVWTNRRFLFFGGCSSVGYAETYFCGSFDEKTHGFFLIDISIIVYHSASAVEPCVWYSCRDV